MLSAPAFHPTSSDESPHLYFIHFWADGLLPDVLEAIKAALDAACSPA